MLLFGDVLTIDQGTTWSDTWVFEEGEDDASLEPVELVTDGWVARCEVRRGPDKVPVLASWHSDPEAGADGLILLTDDGEVSLTLDADVSVPWTWWRYADAVFDIELEHPASGRVVRITEGAAVLRPEVTES